MIIVKTKNGDVFVNEKEALTVMHNRRCGIVSVRYAGKDVPDFRILDVEGVIYTNEAQPTKWMTEGSQIEKMREQLKKNHDELCRLAAANRNLLEERDELKEQLARLKNRSEITKAVAAYKNDRLVDTLAKEIERLDIEENGQKKGHATRFLNAAKAQDIDTVGQLLTFGRARLEGCRNISRITTNWVSKALDSLYGIKGW